MSHFKFQVRGKDGIPHSIVAKALPVVAPILIKLFNSSVANGVFPPTWKRTRIITLENKSVPSSSFEFRPIALMCFVSKVLEKLAHDQVVDFLATANILDLLFQTDFRKYHNTQTVLLKLSVWVWESGLLPCFYNLISVKRLIQYHRLDSLEN